MRQAESGLVCGPIPFTLPDLPFSDKNHGFVFTTPNSLKDGGTHTIYAYAIDSEGGTNPLLNNSPKTITCGSAPSPPSNVQATDGTYTDRVRITWSASSGATSYEVYRATSSGGTKSQIGTPSGTYYNDTSASTGTTYYYWVKAKNTWGTSGYSSYNTGYRAQLNVTPTSHNFSNSGGNKTISVTSNVSWSVSDNASWLSVSPTSGSNNGSFSINCGQNTSTSQRSGTVTVSGGGLTKEIQIIQEETPLPILSVTKNGNGKVKVNGTLHELPWDDQFSSGETVSLEAVPDTGWKFVYWSVDHTDTANPTTINMNGSKTITANFILDVLAREVPNVVGMSQEAAESAITDAGFIVGSITEECSNTIPADNVISQNPAAGAMELPGSTVTLVVSTGQCPEVPKDNWSILYTDSEETNVVKDLRAVNAIDDNPATIWHTEWKNADPVCPHELWIDMGHVYSISGFGYLPRQDGSPNGRIAEYKFYVSVNEPQNADDWGDPVCGGVFANNALEKEALLTEAVPGRYVRLQALSEVNNNPWTSAAEINVLGVINAEH